MNVRIFFWSITSALAGFLFGFDTVVISGAEQKIQSFFPLMMAAFAPGYVFLIFCGMMVLQLVWVKTMVPETKGVPLEQMQKRLGIE